MSLLDQHRFHPRRFADNRFVYPVVSRRSQGISIGVNLNPDKICNFDCIYCQVDRRSPAETRFVELDQLMRELDDVIQLVISGDLYQFPQFQSVPDHLRRLNDIAFSGDGEPTTYRNFDEILSRTAELKQRHGLDATKLVLITNASMFHHAAVQRGLAIMDAHQGEIWAKLDAGTPEYFQLIERTPIPFQQILDNILLAAKVRPLVIQSLFLRLHDEPPSEAEIDAYVQRLKDITAAGGQLSLVQVYTVARPPAESSVTALSNPEVDHIVARVRNEAQLPTEPYYGR
jgi:wyosine [tRNA(Phe)-imidazoG37] synthetase (radical SAM superfamily)